MCLRLLVALAAALLSAGPARAQSIGPGHEAEVMALLAPCALGEEVSGGFALWGVTIEAARIRLVVRSERGAEAALVLVHPGDAPEAPRAGSFAVVLEPGPPEAAGALERLAEVVRANDDGRFWESAAIVASPAPTSGAPEGRSGVRRAMLWGDAEWVPLDGIAVVLIVVVLGLLLAWRHLREAPRWVAGGLAASVVTGIVVRLWLAPPNFLGAWPWSRLYPNARAVAQGRWLAALSELTGERFFLTDVTLWTNFAYAAAMPLVLFSHATYLLRDARAGLAAAAAIALLPQHIRFSRCEDGFVGSLVLTSLAFALIHGWLRDPSPRVRAACLGALPFVLYPGYLLRPLNILFLAVYSVALLFLHTGSAPRHRRWIGLAAVWGAGAFALPQFLARNAESAASSVGPRLGLDAVEVLLSPRLLVLSDPFRTPPLLIAAALAGAVLAWRAGARVLVAFLAGWFLFFVVAHAVVIQESMEPRYHLHLVVPFLLLGALAVVHAERTWWQGRRGRLAACLAGASLLAAPLLHRGFIEDTGYTEMVEYDFVRSLRDEIPAGCTVIEYVGGLPGEEGGGSRMERIGWYATPGRSERFSVVRVHLHGRTTPETRSLEALAERPPACLYLYEGLACATAAGPDERHACDALRTRFHAETVRARSSPVRLYDTAVDRERVLEPGGRVTFRLARAGAIP
jgi:hypothetical protein